MTSPISMIICIHDPQESSWTIEWVKEIRTEHFGLMRVALEIHASGVEQCMRCTTYGHAIDHSKDQFAVALDAFITAILPEGEPNQTSSP